MNIHPTAIIDPKAELGQDVTVGPYTVIAADVVIGSDTVIMPHAYIDRYTTIGAGCRIFPFASVGAEPQDLKFKGEKTELVIGDQVTIRECVTIHRGTAEGGGRTVVGDHSLLMNYVHIAHDCHIGQHVVLANNLAMGGHVTIEDHVNVGGMVAIHQFTRIGTHSFIGGFSRVSKDVPPYLLGEGAVDFILHGPNLIGLRRKGFDSTTISALKDAFRLIFRNHRPLQQVLDEALALFPTIPEVQTLVEFVRTSARGVYR
ncbi:MAG: acyl-ACP--UDP-N-acetylglucosamine O-acyltransferase [Deltaproteobacteria bacterium]|nr:acyl-ACP--UDP-N-acetylglucosamine O-acyltransferase [Deltaproteobacteria bacterium]